MKNNLSLCLVLSLLVFSHFNWVSSLRAENRPKVGVILPLSGPLAEFGVALKNGIELAGRQSNDTLKDLEFIYEDSQYRPQTALLIFRKFAADPDVKFIVNFGCPTSQVLAPLADQLKIPTALFCSSPMLTKGRTYAFGMTSPTNEWASILNDFLASSGFKKLCVVLTENDYLVSEFNALKSTLAKDQNITLIDSYSPDDNDFRSSALKLRSSACDALGVYLLPGQVRLFFGQVRNEISNLQIFGTDIFESKDEILASKDAMEGAVFVNVSVPSPFTKQYIETFLTENHLTMACVIHDIILRVGRLLLDSPKIITSKEFLEKIQHSGEQNGSCGTSTFVQSQSGEQYVSFPLTLKKVVHRNILDYKR